MNISSKILWLKSPRCRCEISIWSCNKTWNTNLEFDPRHLLGYIFRVDYRPEFESLAQRPRQRRRENTLFSNRKFCSRLTEWLLKALRGIIFEIFSEPCELWLTESYVSAFCYARVDFLGAFLPMHFPLVNDFLLLGRDDFLHHFFFEVQLFVLLQR